MFILREEDDWRQYGEIFPCDCAGNVHAVSYSVDRYQTNEIEWDENVVISWWVRGYNKPDIKRRITMAWDALRGRDHCVHDVMLTYDHAEKFAYGILEALNKLQKPIEIKKSLLGSFLDRRQK